MTAAVCTFPDLTAAVDCVMATIQSGIPMARIEFLDPATVAACNAYSGTSLPLAPQVMVEFHGSPKGVAEQAERFGDIDLGAGTVVADWDPEF